MSSTSTQNQDLLTVGLAQIAPVWLNRKATLVKIIDYIGRAAEQRCRLVTFGEAMLPGYPFWVELTDGARFNSSIQKDIPAYYLEQAVQIEAGHLDAVCAAAAKHGIAVMLGYIERRQDRGGYSVYCSRVYIGADGVIGSVHRKLMPTYEERLAWSPGDGHGLRVHPLDAFTIHRIWIEFSRSVQKCWRTAVRAFLREATG